MTRAQALLIVVGNPVVLSLDPLWRSFLNFVHGKGGWRGIGITWNPQEEVNIMDAGYDAKYRAQAEAQLEDTLTRLRAIVSQNLEQFDLDIDLGSDGDDETYIERETRRDGE
jgi:helicase MOV-10